MEQNIEKREAAHTDTIDFLNCAIVVGDRGNTANEMAWLEMQQMKNRIKVLEDALHFESQQPTVQRLREA